MKTRYRIAFKSLLFVSAATLLTACQTTPSFRSVEHIDFRADRYDELRLVADFNECKNEGLELDRKLKRAKIFLCTLQALKNYCPAITNSVEISR